MVSEKVLATLDLDTNQAEQDIADLMNKADNFTRRWNTTFTQVTAQIQSATRMISSIAGVVSQVANVMGDTLDPAFQALIITVQSASAALSSIAAAYTATGVGTVLAATIAVAAFSLNLKTLTELMAGRDEVAGELQKMRGVADSLSTMINAMGG